MAVNKRIHFCAVATFLSIFFITGCDASEKSSEREETANTPPAPGQPPQETPPPNTPAPSVGKDSQNPDSGTGSTDDNSFGTTLLDTAARDKSQSVPPPPPANQQPPSPTPNPMPAPAPAPAPAPVPPPPPVPQTTHKLTVDCTKGLRIDFEFGGRVQTFRLNDYVNNNKPGELTTQHCPKIKAALDQKALPLQNTLSVPQGGSGLKVTCNTTTLRFSYVSGNVNDGSGYSISQSVDIESVQVCYEVRNIINGLKLENKRSS